MRCYITINTLCIALNGSNTVAIGRKTTDHTCQPINAAVGVDQCATGQFCLDASSNPTRCVALDDISYLGRAASDQSCLSLNIAGADTCTSTGFFCLDTTDSNRCKPLSLAMPYNLLGRKLGTGQCQSDTAINSEKCAYGDACIDTLNSNKCQFINTNSLLNRVGIENIT